MRCTGYSGRMKVWPECLRRAENGKVTDPVDVLAFICGNLHGFDRQSLSVGRSCAAGIRQIQEAGFLRQMTAVRLVDD